MASRARSALSTLFTTSGVERRERQMLKDQGVPDPEGKNYSDLDEKKYGGKIKMMGLGGATVSKSFYRGIPIRAQNFKSLYKPA